MFTFLRKVFRHPSSDPVEVWASKRHVKEPPPGVRQINDSLWEFYSPTNEVELEIIFFHGLQLDDYENAFWKAWVAKDDDEVIWPKDWLSKKLPKARILSVSYASSAKQRERNLFNLGENLVDDIILDGVVNIGQRCPVFLVGHDLGGIVIRHFVLFAMHKLTEKGESRTFSRIETFLQNLNGAFFYSTPSHDTTPLDEFASRLHDPSPILHLLKTFIKETEWINAEFGRYRLVKRIRTFGMAALLPTFYRGFNVIVVSEASARQEAHADESYTNTTADHFSVCKARGPHDCVIAKLTAFVYNGL